MSKRRVVVLGGGYAGVQAAYELASRTTPHELEIVLIADSDQHIEVPSLYEVATAYVPRESGFSSEYICQGVGVPLRDIFLQMHVVVRHARVESIDAASRLVVLEDNTSLSFDWLIVGVGTTLATFRVPGVREYAFTLKTLPEALRARHHIVRTALRAARPAMVDRTAAATFVVVGGGSAGVETASELAGLFAAMRRSRPMHLFTPRIILVEAGPSILPDVPLRLRKRVEKRLSRLGIEVLTEHPVVAVDPNWLTLRSGTQLPSHTVLWTGGLAASDLLTRSGLPIHAWGADVNDYLQVQGHPHIFAAGDCAVLTSRTAFLPATVPVAFREGRHAARNVLRTLRGQSLLPFTYTRRNYIITVGGRTALWVLPGNWGMLGFWPWLLREFIFLRHWWRYLPFWQGFIFWWRGVRVRVGND